METLKNLFGNGALTYDQFAEKLKDSKDVKLANLAEGQYVGKDKYTALEAERNALKTQLSEENTKLKGYDPEWEAKAGQARKDAEAQVGKVKLEGSRAKSNSSGQQVLCQEIPVRTVR